MCVSMTVLGDDGRGENRNENGESGSGDVGRRV